VTVDSRVTKDRCLLLSDRYRRAGRLLDAAYWPRNWPLPVESSDVGAALYPMLAGVEVRVRATELIDLLVPLWIEWSAEVGGMLDDTMGPGVPAGGSGRD